MASLYVVIRVTLFWRRPLGYWTITTPGRVRWREVESTSLELFYIAYVFVGATSTQQPPRLYSVYYYCWNMYQASGITTSDSVHWCEVGPTSVGYQNVLKCRICRCRVMVRLLNDQDIWACTLGWGRIDVSWITIYVAYRPNNPTAMYNRSLIWIMPVYIKQVISRHWTVCYQQILLSVRRCFNSIFL